MCQSQGKPGRHAVRNLTTWRQEDKKKGTRKVLLSIELTLQNAKQFQHPHVSSHVKFENCGSRKPVLDEFNNIL
jgi:hypothetical protein